MSCSIDRIDKLTTFDEAIEVYKNNTEVPLVKKACEAFFAHQLLAAYDARAKMKVVIIGNAMTFDTSFEKYLSELKVLGIDIGKILKEIPQPNMITRCKIKQIEQYSR